MKRLSDYLGREAIDLWADILEPAARILGDKNVTGQYKKNEPYITLVKLVLKTHGEDIIEILERIDPEPVNAFNIVSRSVQLVNDISESKEFGSFFGFAGQEQTASVSSGSATENTGAEKN